MGLSFKMNLDLILNYRKYMGAKSLKPIVSTQQTNLTQGDNRGEWFFYDQNYKVVHKLNFCSESYADKMGATLIFTRGVVGWSRTHPDKLKRLQNPKTETQTESKIFWPHTPEEKKLPVHQPELKIEIKEKQDTDTTETKEQKAEQKTEEKPVEKEKLFVVEKKKSLLVLEPDTYNYSSRKMENGEKFEFYKKIWQADKEEALNEFFNLKGKNRFEKVVTHYSEEYGCY